MNKCLAKPDHLIPNSDQTITKSIIQLSYSFFIVLASPVFRFVSRISLGCNIFTILLTIIIESIHARTYFNWQESSDTLSSNFGPGAIGYSSSTGTIWLLGGYSTRISEIDAATETITSSTYFPYDPVEYLYGYGQFWTSVDHYVYMIDPYEARTFIRFDVDTGTPDIHYEGINITEYADCWSGPYDFAAYHSCLTSINVDAVDYLVVIGGAKNGRDDDPCGGTILSGDNTQILSLTDFEWKTSAKPRLSVPRRSSACVTHQNSNTIYVIGGVSDDGCCNVALLDTVQTLTINDMSTITSHSWGTLGGTLSTVMPTNPIHADTDGPRALVVDTDILVFLEWEINVIDTSTKSITIQGNTPRFGYNSAAIVAGDTIWFVRDNKWWTLYVGPTQQPTPAPTRAPTTPTSNPTRVPTRSPTTATPTQSPTTATPTHTPSQTPTSTTRTPTQTPSETPTNFPTSTTRTHTHTPSTTPITETPTQTPSDAPTSAVPTKTPSTTPSKTPTQSPITKTPTKTPSTTPSKTPSESPNTAFPSVPPTTVPTQVPSENPTKLTIGPSKSPITYIPTGFPSDTPSVAPIDAFSSTNGDSDQSVIGVDENEQLAYGVGLTSAVVVIAVCALCGQRVYKRLIEADDDEDNLAAHVSDNDDKKDNSAAHVSDTDDKKDIYTKEVEQWDVDDVYVWLLTVSDGALTELAKKFKKAHIRGRALDTLTDEHLDEFDIKLGDRMEFRLVREQLFATYRNQKEDNDNVEQKVEPGYGSEMVDEKEESVDIESMYNNDGGEGGMETVGTTRWTRGTRTKERRTRTKEPTTETHNSNVIKAEFENMSLEEFGTKSEIAPSKFISGGFGYVIQVIGLVQQENYEVLLDKNGLGLTMEELHRLLKFVEDNCFNTIE